MESAFVPMHSVRTPVDFCIEPLPEDDVYSIIPATFEPGKTGPFFLSVSAECGTSEEASSVGCATMSCYVLPGRDSLHNCRFLYSVNHRCQSNTTRSHQCVPINPISPDLFLPTTYHQTLC